MDPVGVGESGGAGGPGGLVARIGIPDYAAVLQNFKEVVNPSKILPPVTNKVIHHIVTSGCPVAAKYWRLDPVRGQWGISRDGKAGHCGQVR